MSNLNDNKYAHIPYQDLSAQTNMIDKSDNSTNSNNFMESESSKCQNDSIMKLTDNKNSGWLSVLFNNRFASGIYHAYKNQSYEVYIMYTLIILVIIIMIMMTIDSILDYDMTMINLKRAEIVSS